jgi:hypothetical protein
LRFVDINLRGIGFWIVLIDTDCTTPARRPAHASGESRRICLASSFEDLPTHEKFSMEHQN